MTFKKSITLDSYTILLQVRQTLRDRCQLGHSGLHSDYVIHTEALTSHESAAKARSVDLIRARARSPDEDRRKIAVLLVSSCCCSRGHLKSTARRARSILRVVQRSNKLARLTDGTNYYRHCTPQITAEVASELLFLRPVVSSFPRTKRTRATTDVVYR